MGDIVSLKDVHSEIGNVAQFAEMPGPYFEVEDFGHTYRYVNVFDPAGRQTDKWELFIQKPNSTVWQVVNGLLTNNYSVVPTERVLATIKSQLGGDVRGERHFINGATMYCRFALQGYELEYAEKDDVTKMIFNLMTDIDVDALTQEYILSFNLINNLSGTQSLRLNYGFLCNLKSADKKNTLAINNMHVLKEFESILVHNSQLNVNYVEVNNVKEAIGNQIEKFKKIDISPEFLEEFKMMFPVKIVKEVFDIWARITEEYRNMYYFTLIISAVSTSKEKIDFEVRSRNFIAEYIKELDEKASKAAVKL